VFGERYVFRTAFREFDVAKVAAITEHDIDRLVQGRAVAHADDAGRLRNSNPAIESAAD
jgi:hypothetical protein